MMFLLAPNCTPRVPLGLFVASSSFHLQLNFPSLWLMHTTVILTHASSVVQHQLEVVPPAPLYVSTYKE